jgi:hypothetical protein
MILYQDPVRARLSRHWSVSGEPLREVPRLPLNRPVVASQTSQGANRLVPAAAVICLPIATTAAQQPLLDQVGQCASRLEIMLPSPGDQQNDVCH